MSWSRVGGTNDSLQAGSDTTRVLTLGTAVAVGDVIEVWPTWVNNVTVSSITDSLGNTYTAPAARLANPEASTQFNQYWYSIVTNAGTPDITVNFSGAAVYRASPHNVYRETGGAPTFNDQSMQAQSNPGTGTDAVSSSSVTIDTAGSLLTGFTQNESGSNNISLGTGFSAGATLSISGTVFGRSGYKTADASAAVTWTTSSSTEDFYSQGAAFDPPAGGGGSDIPGPLAGYSGLAGTVSGGVGLARLVQRSMTKLGSLWVPSPQGA